MCSQAQQLSSTTAKQLNFSTAQQLNSATSQRTYSCSCCCSYCCSCSCWRISLPVHGAGPRRGAPPEEVSGEEEALAGARPRGAQADEREAREAAGQEGEEGEGGAEAGAEKLQEKRAARGLRDGTCGAGWRERAPLSLGSRIVRDDWCDERTRFASRGQDQGGMRRRGIGRQLHAGKQTLR